MHSCIFIVGFLLLSTFCSGQNDRTVANTSETVKREIPINKEGARKGGREYLFTSIMQDAKQLGLENLENGFDSLQIRIWLGHSLAKKRNVLILKKVNGQWSSQLITFSFQYDGIKQKEVLLNQNSKEVYPKSGWKIFTDSLMKLNILTLPNGQDINGYNSCGGNDGIDYYFEIATPKLYRFYYYCNPNENKNQFWQVRNIISFSSLLEREFSFTYTK